MKKTKLGTLCTIKGGIPAPKITAAMGSIPFVRMRELGDSHLSSSFFPGQEYLTEADANVYASKIIEPGAVLFPRSGSVHLNHRAHLNSRAAIVSHIGALVPNDNTDSHFLYHLLTAYDMTEIMTQTTGLNMIRFSQLSDVEFLVPKAKPEQSKIAEVLSKVDQAIAQTESLIAKQQRIKTGLMQDLLTRGIDEHGNLRSEETHEFKDSPLGRIPVEWEVRALFEVVDLRVGYAFKSSWFAEDGIRLLRGENVGTGKAEWKDTQWLPHHMVEKYSEYLLAEGDLIIGMDRTFTKQGFKLTLLSKDDAPCLLVQRVGCFVPLGIPAEFMRLLIQSPQYQQVLLLQQKGMDIPHLSKDEILSPAIPVPRENAEMEEISKRLSGLEDVITCNGLQLKKLRSLKTALMQDLLTGKVRVNALLENKGNLT